MAVFRVEGLRITFRATVKSRARRDIMRVDNAGRVHIELRAEPSKGRANDALVRFLSKGLRVPQDSIDIAFGTKSRSKLIRITGHLPPTITDRLMALAAKK